MSPTESTPRETAEAAKACHVCGGFPCYLICPMADPFGGDQRAEDEDYECFASARAEVSR